MSSVERIKRQRHWVRRLRTECPPSSRDEYLRQCEAFFDDYAAHVDEWHRRNVGYHAAIASLYRFYVPPQSNVLEIGSGNGDLLAAVEPARGVGIDISAEMVSHAATKYPHLEFRWMSAESLDMGGEQFDYILLSDLVSYVYDSRLVLERLRSVCNPRTRLVLHWYSKLWEPILAAAEKVGLKYPQPLLNWTTAEDIFNLLHLTTFEVIHYRRHVLLPKPVPLVSGFLNRYVARLPGFRALCLTNWIVGRPLGLLREEAMPNSGPTVSVICPCRNEAGNIERVALRLPALGSHTELIFVEGHSSDATVEECRRVALAMPEKNIKVFVQEGKGKADAVRLGFSRATGDVLMILDADLSVAPEDLLQFYEALVSGKGEFVSGSRLVYARDPKSMRFLNLIGNKFFALVLSRLLGQPIRDTLCGTKVLWRKDYERLVGGRAYFGEFDPFGDFELLFGAVKLNLKIVEIPVRYRQRVYGQTNINRFADGWLLLKMCFFAARKILFV